MSDFKKITIGSTEYALKDEVARQGVSALESALNSLSGKVISILGDSISTYDGWIPVADGHNLTHRARYKSETSWYTGTVDDTWWKKLIDNSGAKLGINDSWAGSKVSNQSETNTGDVGPDACMAGITRITNLGSNGTPDIIFFYGGTNDAGTGVTIGTFDSTQTYSLDLTTTIWSNFATAYKDAIMRLQHYYPYAKIIVMLPTYTTTYYTIANLDKYNEVIKEVCDYFGIDYIDMRRAGFNFSNISETLGDGVHPTVDGFDMMYMYLKSKLRSIYFNNEEENIVYSITNTLSTLQNADRYIKGVSANGEYEATITGDNKYILTVTMGGIDITPTVFNVSTGKIHISNVTGNVIIKDNSEITWYTDRMDNASRYSHAFNVNGYGWAEQKAYSTLLNSPINIVKFKSNSTSGTLEIGVVNDVGGTAISKVQSIAWGAESKSNNIVTLRLASTITITGTEHIVIFPNNSPDFNMFYRAGGVGGVGFYSRVPFARDSGTTWAQALDAELGIDYGFIS